MNTLRLISTFLLLSAGVIPLYADDALMKFLNAQNKSVQNQSTKNRGNSDIKDILKDTRTATSPFMSKALNRKGDMTSATERYYTGVVRQYGWWIGLGKPMSKAEAQRADHYYRLSDKNGKGRWQRAEYVNNGLIHDNLPRINNLSVLIDVTIPDDERNRDRIRDAVSWQFLSDPTGALMLEERGFDADGNLLYIMNSTEYSEGKFVLSFLDANALPMFSDRTLHVQCDRSGRFHIINFTDDLGYFFPNTEDVYEIHIEYSPNDYNYINCNIAGNPL